MKSFSEKPQSRYLFKSDSDTGKNNTEDASLQAAHPLEHETIAMSLMQMSQMPPVVGLDTVQTNKIEVHVVLVKLTEVLGQDTLRGGYVKLPVAVAIILPFLFEGAGTGFGLKASNSFFTESKMIFV
jgi:hypothetical protein